MTEGGGTRWHLPRLRLAPRLMIAVLLTVLATYLTDQVLRALIPPPPILLVKQSWLVDVVANAARQAAAGEAPLRVQYWDFSVQDTPPIPPATPTAGAGEALRTAIAAALDKQEADIAIAAGTYNQNNLERTVRTAVTLLPELPALLTSEQLASGDSNVLGDLSIAVRLDGKRWLAVAPHNMTGTARHYVRYVSGLAANLLIIIIFSIWMARSIIAPLSRLASAAERLGRDREPTLIDVDGMRLPEYVAIADTFNAMQLRLKTYVDERVQMLAAISHDLRTPLTRLRLLAEYIQDDDQREQLSSNIAEMETMVSDALAFMSGEAQREWVEPVDIAAMLISLSDSHVDLGDSVTYAGPDHVDLNCRPVAMKRTFDNLIANGCKYGEAVAIRLVETQDAVIVDFADRGTGIAPEEAERAFAPFQRLEGSRSRETGGTGLGLAISRDVVRSHGGEISFHRPDRGFIVRVTLPR